MHLDTRLRRLEAPCGSKHGTIRIVLLILDTDPAIGVVRIGVRESNGALYVFERQMGESVDELQARVERVMRVA
jgi:hypothetical protein